MARKKPGKVGENKSEIVRQVPAACADEGTAVAFMEQLRWGDTPRCPLCGNETVYQMLDRKGGREKNYRWRCRECGERFTVRTGTIMAETRMPLRFWCHAFWRVCSSKKGVSAKQIQRETGVSYKSALFLLHRVRFAMADMDGVKFSGTVEVDETYIGGKPRFRIPYLPADVAKNIPNRPKHKKKQQVLGVLCRNTGQVRTRAIPDVTAATLRKAVGEIVDKRSVLHTDEAMPYRTIGREYAGHESVMHSGFEYSRDGVTTNTIESFFAILKRGINGVYHSVSRNHLHRYLAEFDFRYNTRKVDDGARTAAAIRGGIGKRLMYREPIGRLSA